MYSGRQILISVSDASPRQGVLRDGPIVIHASRPASASALSLDPELAKELVLHGFVNAAMVAAADIDDIAALEGFDHASAEAIKAVAATK